VDGLQDALPQAIEADDLPPDVGSAALSGTSIVMSHSSAGIKVSASEAQRLDSESTAQLLSQRRLALIIDLDQTIIHATVDPTVEEWMKDPSNPNYGALATVGRFKLGMDGKSVVKIETHEDMRKRAESAQKEGRETPSDTSDDDDTPDGCWYYVKPRPGLDAFLRTLTQKYELHVYTMGTRSYANCVCKLVDPDGTLFGSRILSRDENGSLMQKSLARLFPVDTSMVVIIDDRSDVWNRSPNLLKVIPYDFFVGIGDINATFLPPPPSLSTPTDELGDISADVAPDMSGDSSVSPAGSATSDAASSTTPATSPAGSVASPGGGTAVTADAEEKAAEAAKETAEKVAEEKAAQTQRAVISEQVDSRPLAKMQEALDEKLSHLPGSVPAAASPAAKGSPDAPPSAPNGKKEENNAHVEELNQFHAMHAVLKDDDEELSRLEDILGTIHEQWYENWDAMYSAKQASMEKGLQNDEQSRRRFLASLPKPSVIVS
jgi:RNA polymerase II subunit A C-terminal domain phosphatase